MEWAGGFVCVVFKMSFNDAVHISVYHIHVAMQPKRVHVATHAHSSRFALRCVFSKLTLYRPAADRLRVDMLADLRQPNFKSEF